jgi:hypothetical protein
VTMASFSDPGSCRRFLVMEMGPCCAPGGCFLSCVPRGAHRASR